MTIACKKRSRLSGRPQASFGSLFTSVLAPAINAGASVLDSSLAKHSAEKQVSNNEPKNDVQTNNISTPKVDVESIKSLNVPNSVEKPLQFNQENVQSDPTKARLGTRIGKRHKCWIGAAIGAATSIAGSLFGNAAQKKEMRRQKSIQDWQNTTQEATAMSTTLNNSQDYQDDYLRQFRTAARLGKTLGAKSIYITDGGDATKIGNNTYLLRGGSHEDVNETGQTGIGINVGGNEIEAEGGEVAQKKNGALRIFSAQPILGNGMSPAQAILRGYNKDSIFSQQQAFKKRNGLKDDGSAKDRTGYGKDFGPIKGGASLIPLITETYNPKRIKHKSGGEVPYNHYDPTGLFGGNPHPLAKMIDITGITSYGDVKKLIDKKRRGEIPTTLEYLGALSAIPAIGRIPKILNMIGNLADTSTFMEDVREAEAKEKAYQNEVVKYADIHGRIKTGRRRSIPYGSYELRKRLGGRAKARIGTKETYGDENKTNITTSNLNGSNYHALAINGEDVVINSNSKTPGGNWDGNIFVPSIWQFGNNGNKIRNKYMNNTGKGYFNGRINVFPRSKYGLGGVKIGSNIGINTNTNIPDYNSAYINWLISQLSSEKDEQQVENYNQEDIDNAVNAANLAYQNYLIRQLPSGKSNKQEDSKTTKHITTDGLKRNTQSVVDASRRSVDFASNTYRSKLISQLPSKQVKTTSQYKDRRSLKDKTQSIVDAARFAVNNAISYRNSKLISQLPSKQDNKVAKRRVKTTPQYKGDVTKGNYQLHDGESKVINGIKYTRMGNTIINHKTNVGYIYDKNGNYTGQADYSKVGKNFNDAFDAARAAGRTNFIYRAGKYNNYSTAKESDAKKEALNRIAGRKRIAKRYGGINPPRKRYVDGGTAYSSALNEVNVTGKNKRKFNEWDNYIRGNVLKFNTPNIPYQKPPYIPQVENKEEEVPYVPQTINRSRTIFSGGDYLGLGIDTLAALSTGLINYNTAGKYVLPDRAPIIQASKLPTTYNISPEIEEAKRYRDRLTSETYNNTSSSVAALNRSNGVNLNALSNLSKLWATKENEENKMLTEDAKNQQSVAVQNAQNELARQSEIARIKNEAIQAKGEALNVGLSGLSQAWTNFWTAGRTAYEDDQARRAMIASSKEASPTRLIEMGYYLSPDVLTSLYQTSTDDRTKRFYLSRLSPKDRIKYGIN